MYTIIGTRQKGKGRFTFNTRVSTVGKTYFICNVCNKKHYHSHLEQGCTFFKDESNIYLNQSSKDREHMPCVCPVMCNLDSNCTSLVMP